MGRLRIPRLVIEVTAACNHACLHCYNSWRGTGASCLSGRTLSRREIRDLTARVRTETRLKQIALSGGEPLLRPDVPEIVRDLAETGLDVMVITNAALLTPGVAGRFPPDTVFEVTLFSADAELHDRIAGRRGAFRHTLEGIVNAHRHRGLLALTCVVTRLNAHDVTRTMELGVALGAQAVLFNRINLTGHTWPQAERLVPTLRQLEDALHAADETARRCAIPTVVSIPIPPCLVDPRQYPDLHFGWCPRGGINSYFTLGCTGLLRPCNHSSIVLGDLRRESFAALARGAACRRFWSNMPAVCRGCHHPLRHQCRGGCPAAAHECFGQPGRLDPFVEHVLKESGRRPPFTAGTLPAQTGRKTQSNRRAGAVSERLVSLRRR
jgi:pyrroloquinoline quinone biosynthesis protein E